MILLAKQNDARAFCRTTTSGRQPIFDQCPAEGAPLAWPSPCTSVSLDPTVIPEGWTVQQLHTRIQTALDRWNLARCEPAPDGGAPRFTVLRYLDCADGVVARANGPRANTISFRRTWADSPSFPPGVIAATLVSYVPSTGEITDADIAFNLQSTDNPEGYTFVSEPSAAPSARDLDAVLTHELGHVMGLAHSDDHSAVMFANYDFVSPRRDLRADDALAICTVYPAGTGSGACDPGRNHPCGPGCRCSAIAAPATAPYGLATALFALTATRCARSRRRRARGSSRRDR